MLPAIKKQERNSPATRSYLPRYSVPLPPRGVFEKTPLGTLKNFFGSVKAKPDGLSVFRAGILSRLKRRAPMHWLALSFCGTLSHTLPRSVFEKPPLGTPKNFFRFVKAKPDGLSVFRAGTWSRLKRLGLFRSCRREASSKTQGLSEDASHHAREHKTPTEGTAHGTHRPAPKNQRFRHSGFFAPPKKYVARPQKKFSDRPLFQKGSPGAGRSPAKGVGIQGGKPCKGR